MNNKRGFFLRLVLGSILCITLSSCESYDTKDATMDDAAARDDAMGDATEAAMEDAADASDDLDRCDFSISYPEGHPCFINPH